ncbi:unnamed protein product [Didymodactylos carnosus]|uniref:protein-serine/threonine phosphatase n=1 Tax=Didymodactylos carnosus TaxID=1234261 RepID=A0A814AZ49_9BILA|nr:unnamed protein product [Didymodactylos carnosus]CAF0919657.1 unnamed protein product [Didymodactylos carnosus]CAF3572764.1 unnamed protein product [Didymodactylos carnosus]CAF3699166.1 unnamed protein product [Didymodactylos carnosus]
MRLANIFRKPMGQFLDKPKVDKSPEKGKIDDIRYGLSHMQGWRVDMEDAHAAVLRLDDNRWSRWSYFGIFDGHAGKYVAILASQRLHMRILQSLNNMVNHEHPKAVAGVHNNQQSYITSSQLDFHKFENAIKDAYFKFDQELREDLRNQSPEDKSGSTAISCLIDPERIYFLNVGDSRAILVSTDGRILMATKDHKPNDPTERQRITEAGGTVLIQRVNGSLAVSRALGDFEYKNSNNRRQEQQLVSPEPEIMQHLRIPPSSQDLKNNTNKHQNVQQDEQAAFILLACDGIWDVMTNEELGAYILGRMQVTDDLESICNQVLDLCLYKGSKDNMSVVIIAFKNAPTPNPEMQHKDKILDDNIKQKTTELYHKVQKQNLDANSLWQQVMLALNEIPSNRDTLPPAGGFISKRYVFEQQYAIESNAQNAQRNTITETINDELTINNDNNNNDSKLRPTSSSPPSSMDRNNDLAAPTSTISGLIE